MNEEWIIQEASEKNARESRRSTMERRNISYWAVTTLKYIFLIREDIRKKRLYFGQRPKGGGIKPESRSFEVVLFSLF